MAKKKTTTTFDPGRFRMGEEASMATIPQTPLQQLQKSTQVAAIDPYYVKDPITGLSPAQVEARAAQAAAKVSVEEAKSAKAKIEADAKAKADADAKAKADAAAAQVAAQAKAAADAFAAQQAAAKAAEDKRRQGQSAYDLLFNEFENYGLGALVQPLQSFIIEGLSPAEFTLRMRQTDAYKKRFAANAQRINKGLRALSEAEYIGLEDQYQNVMRNYGLPKEYYSRGEMGVQQGFEKFIGGDVSAAELEDRIQTAQNRVLNAAPEVSSTLRQFYPDIKDGDILAYALDPEQALTNIKRKVQAAEIGAGAVMAGLSTGLARAEELQRYGVTAEQARQGFQTIGSFLPRASTLADIYGKQGVGPYTQTTAEAEVFGTPGAIEAEKKRKQLAQLEQAAFSGKTGAAGGALGRERAGQF